MSWIDESCACSGLRVTAEGGHVDFRRLPRVRIGNRSAGDADRVRAAVGVLRAQWPLAEARRERVMTQISAR